MRWKKTSFHDKGEIEAFPDKQKGRCFVNSEWALQEIIKGLQ
jgi:hypothetical protein